MKKKDLPIEILKVLEKYVSIHGEKYIKIQDPESLLKFIDIDEESSFFFCLNLYQNEKFIISYKPYNRSNVDLYKISIKPNELDGHFKLWINLLDEYANTKSIFDDPILKFYEEEFYAEFEILEDEKEKPLDNNQILFLDDYLENLDKGLEKYKIEGNKIRIENIQKEIKQLQETLTEKNKEQVVTSFSKILAKVKKLGVKYLKEFITEGTKQVISTTIKYLIENGHNLIS
ncbi:hypothetical protein [Flavobacterium sp. GCM10023249]|uniref:hypothetical protein n=1 Tax=unclassified Flavobacterium TaxID=196869 RepID=UPI003611CD01